MKRMSVLLGMGVALLSLFAYGEIPQRQGTRPQHMLAAQNPPPTPPGPSAPFYLTVKAPPAAAAGRLVSIEIDTNATWTKWSIKPATADIFREYDPESTKIKLRGQFLVDGVYTLTVGAGDAKTGDLKAVDILIGAPTPTPPGPTPDPKPPTPDTKPPIPAKGLHVLIIYGEDEAKRPILTKSQSAELYGEAISQYLNSKCAKVDGNAEYRIWAANTPIASVAEYWRQGMGRTRTREPWLIISDGANGSFEGPLPDGQGAILETLKKYGG